MWRDELLLPVTHAMTKHGSGQAGDPAARQDEADVWSPKVMLSPQAGSWNALVSGYMAPASAPRFREQMGLPSGRVVMSGHQAELWHAGILTKLLALGDAARSSKAAAAWLVVDQDANEPGIIRYPSSGKTLVAAEWRISASDARKTDVPVAARAAFSARELEPRWGDKPAATGAVACGLGAIRDAFLDTADAPDLAEQVIRTTRKLLGPMDAGVTWIRATGMTRTELFAEVVERMKADPAACIAAYNAAVARHAGAGMAPLNAARGELPLWRVRADAARGRVLASTIAGIPTGELAPRALLMTGLMRHAGCELFIHGLGGGKYDVIAEEWLGAWLSWKLAPAVVATGTLLAKLSDSPPPSPESLARARWSLHHARHTPQTLGDSWSQRRKEELVEEIRGLRKRGADSYRAYSSLQELLSRVRIEHQDALAGLAREVSALESRAKESKVALDRTWAFPLHERGSIQALQAAVSAAFGGGR